MTALTKSTGCQALVEPFDRGYIVGTGATVWRAPNLPAVTQRQEQLCWTAAVSAPAVDQESRTVSGSPWNRRGESLTRTVEAQMKIIAEAYAIEDLEALRDYLRSHVDLVQVLELAHARIGEWFTDAEVALRVRAAHGDRGARRLHALIHTKLEPHEALGRLDEFDESWWLEASRSVEDRLLIDVEYVE